jgi:hypothetical protein
LDKIEPNLQKNGLQNRPGNKQRADQYIHDNAYELMQMIRDIDNSPAQSQNFSQHQHKHQQEDPQDTEEFIKSILENQYR